jgi:ring-1,2-phenylacetyl-CoA epoxidase subunit PaaC
MTGHTDPASLDNAYGGLVEADSDARWAFGTGFDDPLAGVDVTVPPGVDPPLLAAYSLMLADDALVSAQRLTQWCTHSPELEEEVALANIALDLLGQARLLLARAAAADPAVVPELPTGSPVPPDDRLAFFRGPSEFRCVWLVELPNGDFATTVVRLAVFSAWRLAVLERLRGSMDPVLAAVAEKGVKEVRYHRDYAARWLLTLAGGTAYSRHRVAEGLTAVWPYVAELDRAHPVTTSLIGSRVAAEPEAAWADAEFFLRELLGAATLALPVVAPDPGREGRAGRDGVHTRWLAPLLEEMQHIARAHPQGRW